MEFQFTPHSIDRICGRYANLVTYGEVQSAVAAKCNDRQLRTGNAEVFVKQLTGTHTVKDETAFNGKVTGSKVFALVHVNANGAFVDTVVLR